MRRLSRLASAALPVLGRLCAFYLVVLGALALWGLTGEAAHVLALALTGLTALGAVLDCYAEHGAWLLRWRRYITPPGRKAR